MVELASNHERITSETAELYVPAQICVQCKQQKALHEADFAVKRRSFRGDRVLEWDDTCLVCRDMQTALSEHVDSQRIKEAAILRIMGAVSRGEAAPHTADLMAGVYARFKGVAGLADEIYDLYHICKGKEKFKEASAILRTIIQLQIKVGQQQQELDLELMTREQLQEHAQGLVLTLLDSGRLPRIESSP